MGRQLTDDAGDGGDPGLMELADALRLMRGLTWQLRRARGIAQDLHLLVALDCQGGPFYSPHQRSGGCRCAACARPWRCDS